MSDLAQIMLDNSPEMLLLVDPATLQIAAANAPVAKALGYAPEQLPGMPITDIESALPDFFYWEDVRVGQHLEVHQQEGQYRRADGELLLVTKSIRLLEQHGQKWLLVLATQAQGVRQVQDALAHTLSQLRATLESTGNGILVLDWHGKVNGMNRQFSRMWALPEELLRAQDDAKVLAFMVDSVVESDRLRSHLKAIVDPGDAGHRAPQGRPGV